MLVPVRPGSAWNCGGGSAACPRTMTPGRKLFLSLAMILAAGWIYGPALHGGWIWDDKTEIPRIAALHGPGLLGQIWLTPDTGDYYPLKVTVEWLQWQAWGNNTLGYHLTNVCLHVASALLLWWLLRKLGVRCARFAGLLFIVHPLVVESVAWVDELKNTLSLPLLLFAMIAYLEYDERGRRLWYGISVGCFLAAMLSKSSVVMFPVILLLHAWWKRGTIRAADGRAAAPFLVISLGLGLVAIRFQQVYGFAGDGTVALGGLPTRLARAGLVAAFYFYKSVLPIGLMPIYPRWTIEPVSIAAFLPWLALAGVFAFLWSRRQAWGRHVLFGLGWFFLNLAPVVGFIAISHMRFTWAMDHLAYLPLVGLVGLAAAGLGALELRWARSEPGWRWTAMGAAAALCAVLAVDSRAYAAKFRSAEDLWSYELEHNPDAWVAHNNLGEAYFERGAMPQAIAQYQEAIRLAPQYVYSHLNLALAWGSVGHWPEATAEDREALRLRPGWAGTNKALADVLSRNGHPAEAIPYYETALRITPDFAAAENGLGSVLFRTDDIRGAWTHFQRALQLKPDYPEAHNNLGVILAGTGHKAEAIEHFETALRLNPNYADARASLEAVRRAP
jgi:Tfp pilus assembly protein PilF